MAFCRLSVLNPLLAGTIETGTPVSTLARSSLLGPPRQSFAAFVGDPRMGRTAGMQSNALPWVSRSAKAGLSDQA